MSMEKRLDFKKGAFAPEGCTRIAGIQRPTNKKIVLVFNEYWSKEEKEKEYGNNFDRNIVEINKYVDEEETEVVPFWEKLDEAVSEIYAYSEKNIDRYAGAIEV